MLPVMDFRKACQTAIHSVLLLTSILPRIKSDEHDHKYQHGEEVVLWMNTVGPFHNRQETYAYFSLPFCAGPKETINHYHETLADALQGVELEFSGLDLVFQADVIKTEYCQIKDLSEDKYNAFVYAVKNHYWYQMYMDDLPIWGIIGEADSGLGHYIWTHKKFDIGFNGNQIVDVNLTSESKVKLEKNMDIAFTYQATWKKSDVMFESRFNKYLDPSFFQHRIHWFSLFNSFMMVIFLVGLVSMILMRSLRKDYARYSHDDVEDMERDLGDEYGWKQVHGDVFRPPVHPMLFSAMVGIGCQVSVATLCVVIFAILGELYTERGSLLSTGIFVYAATSPFNGYCGGGLYSRMGGKHWIKQMLVSASFLPLIVCGLGFSINIIAIYYHASRAIPFGSMIAVVSICLFIVLPLTLVGTIFGRNMSGSPDHPCRVNAVPRPIPNYKKWFMEPGVIAAAGGVLPFGSIFIEMYFIFTSFWAYKIYYVYGFMLFVFLILAVVTVCVTICCTYFLLNTEDYRWQWTTFMAAASTAGYVYAYSFYYFFFKTRMYGLFQTTFYFGNMAIFSISLGLMSGFFGFTGANVFVRKIYSTVKID